MSELDELLKDQERKFSRRARERMVEHDAIYLRDLRSHLTERARHRHAIEIAKHVLGGMIVIGMILLLFWMFSSK